MRTTNSNADDDQLVAALHGDDRSWRHVEVQFKKYLRTIVRRRAGSLPDDIHEEVVQEVWLAIIRLPPDAYDPLKESAKSFVSRFVSNALTVVMANNRPPLEKSRVRRRVSRKPVLRTRTTPIPVPVPECDELPDPNSAAWADAIDARIDAERLIVAAPVELGKAIRMLRETGCTMNIAAEGSGISRWTLTRRLRALGESLRAA